MARPIRIPDFTHELRQSAWLAGFIDGEGHLGVHRAPSGNCWPVLQIVQRDDDRQLLLTIADALGAALKVTTTTRPGRNCKPYGQIRVTGKAPLLGAVAYLDAYPLRTKKAAEYVVWRGAVITYVNHGGRSPMLIEAKARLESLRVYKEAAVPERDELADDVSLQLLLQGPA